jgi:hypothetical protein
MAAEDRLALRQFMTDFDRFIALAVQPSRLLPDDRARELSEAHLELTDLGMVEQVRAALENPALDEPGPPLGDFGTSGERPSRLEQFGLTGANLRAKLAGWGRAFARLSENGAPVLAFFRSAFRWANTILGSIIAALGLGEALKELKEAAENSYEDAAEGI